MTRDDIESGNVWPEEEPGPLCSRCETKPNVPDEWLCADCRDELAEQANQRYRAEDWPRSSRGMDHGLFC
jgi:rubredoxin